MKWWREAGVDTIVADEPRSWLEVAKPAKSKATAHAVPQTPPGAQTAGMSLPDEIGALRQWLLTDDRLPGEPAERRDATGDPSSGLMIVVDMPERGDLATGCLLSGEVGMLFDRMLAAIGRDRSSTYIVPLSPARIAGGSIDDQLLAMLGNAARHHAALAAPNRLIAMGDAPSRAFCGASLKKSRESQHIFNHKGGNVTVTATFHPRFLLQQPRLKAQSWRDLLMVIEGMTT